MRKAEEFATKWTRAGIHCEKTNKDCSTCEIGAIKLEYFKCQQPKANARLKKKGITMPDDIILPGEMHYNDCQKCGVRTFNDSKEPYKFCLSCKMTIC